MSAQKAFRDFVRLEAENGLWDHFHTIAPLVVIGTKEEQGFDLAPKHMLTPIGFSNYFCFVCTPRHHTYHNIKEHQRFSVSYIKPEQVVLSSLSAMPRCGEEQNEKDIISQLPIITSEDEELPFLKDAYLFFDCRLERIVDDFDDYSLIIGSIDEAWVDPDYKILSDGNEQEQLYEHPLVAYVAPGRYAEIRKTMNFPFPKDFKK